PREDRHPGTPGVRGGGGLGGLVVPAELDQGVDPGAQGPLAVRVLLQGPVRVPQGTREVVPGGGERGASGQGRFVAGGEGERAGEGPFGPRIVRGVARGPRLLDVGEAQGGPRAVVPWLGPQMSPEGTDPRVEVAPGEQSGGERPGRGRGVRPGPRPVRPAPDGDGP